jgi:hypothetical protein
MFGIDLINRDVTSLATNGLTGSTTTQIRALSTAKIFS